VKQSLTAKSLVALAIVGVLAAFFGLCLVSATQLLAPRDMPFGVTGPSPVVDAVKSKFSLDVTTYSSQADLMQAAGRGDIYGGYIPGSSADKLVTVPAKSFFGEVYVGGGFADAAKKAGRTFTTAVIAPLPTSDRTGAVAGLLLLPTLIGGYLYASMMFPYARAASAWRRVAILLGFSVVIAVITAVVAGPVTGAVPSSHVWSLLPCFALVVAAVALAAVGIQAVLGKAGTALVVVAFIMVGGSGAGGAGVALLPTYWQHIGAVLPPRYAIELYRNVRYFDGNHILLPIAVLLGYALAGGALLLVMERRRAAGNRPAAAVAHAMQNQPPPAAAPADEPAATRRRFVPKNLVAPVILAVLVTTLFAFNYMSSGHEPVASRMPFGVVGSSSLAQAAQDDLFSLQITTYPTQAAATEAMDRGQIFGALIASTSPAQVIVVPSISDLAPLDIASHFEKAAKATGQTITVKPYEPTPLAPKDPFALVLATLLVPLLVGGYVATALLTNAMGTAASRFRGLWYVGFAVVFGLVIDLIATYWLDAIPTASFWIVWPIMALIVVTVSLFAAVLRRLLGPLGILVTVILFMQFGNPSSGGSNGVPYLPTFWHDLGPFLPPRNAADLLRNTVYFGGNGIGRALTVLLAYTVIAGGILGFLTWYRPQELSVPGVDQDTAADAAAVSVPAVPLP
jgi:hypothetical protein